MADRIRARSAINTVDRGPQGRDNRARIAINLRPEDGYLQLVNHINKSNQPYVYNINFNTPEVVQNESIYIITRIQ